MVPKAKTNSVISFDPSHGPIPMSRAKNNEKRAGPWVKGFQRALRLQKRVA